MRLVASYHGVSEKLEVENNWPAVYEWHERATLPIEKGGLSGKELIPYTSKWFNYLTSSSL